MPSGRENKLDPQSISSVQYIPNNSDFKTERKICRERTTAEKVTMLFPADTHSGPAFGIALCDGEGRGWNGDVG